MRSSASEGLCECAKGSAGLKTPKAKTSSSASGGLRPASRAGIVLILHGLSEHSGRYRHVAKALTAAGFACYGPDHRGHGKSGGTRAFIPDGQLAINDLDELYRIVRAETAEGPIFAFGHSMGSLIGLGFARRYPDRLRGLITSGAPLHSEDRVPAPLVWLCLKVAERFPMLRLSPPGGSGALTRDADMMRAWRSDPLIDRGMWRVGTSAALVRLARDIRQSAASIKVPLMILHGTADPLAPASGSEFLAAEAGSRDTTLKLYPGLLHELVNEVERDLVIGDMRDWLVERL